MNLPGAGQRVVRTEVGHALQFETDARVRYFVEENPVLTRQHRSHHQPTGTCIRNRHRSGTDRRDNRTQHLHRRRITRRTVRHRDRTVDATVAGFRKLERLRARERARRLDTWRHDRSVELAQHRRTWLSMNTGTDARALLPRPQICRTLHPRRQLPDRQSRGQDS